MISQIIDIQKQDQNAIAEIKEWLPIEIIDAHCHCEEQQDGQTILNEQATAPALTFNAFPFSEHQKLLNQILPGINWTLVTFGFPTSNNCPSANRYNLRLSQYNRSVIPLVFETVPPTAERLKKYFRQGFRGIKIYPSPQQKKTSTKIIDVFPEKVIKFCNESRLALLIHLPNGLITNLEELLLLARKYPNAKFVIAHFGNTYFLHPDFLSAIKKFQQYQNIFFDTAMVSDEKLIAETMLILGPHRILFGSDAPFSYIHGQYIVNEFGKLRLQSRFHFSWIDSQEHATYSNKSQTFQFAYLQIILAIKHAIEKVARPEQQIEFKQRIFYQNSAEIF